MCFVPQPHHDHLKVCQNDMCECVREYYSLFLGPISLFISRRYVLSWTSVWIWVSRCTHHVCGILSSGCSRLWYAISVWLLLLRTTCSAWLLMLKLPSEFARGIAPQCRVQTRTHIRCLSISSYPMVASWLMHGRCSSSSTCWDWWLDLLRSFEYCWSCHCTV